MRKKADNSKSMDQIVTDAVQNKKHRNVYLPLAYAIENEESGLIGIMRMVGLDEEIPEVTGENCLAMCSDPTFYTQKYRGPMKKTHDQIIMNSQISTTFFGNNNPRNEWKDVLSMYGVIDKWSRSKQVYKFDRDFALELSKTEGLKIYPEILRRLPYSTFYLDFSEIPEFTPFDGMFVDVTVFDNDDIRICGHRVIKDVYYTCTTNLREDVREYENGVAFYDYTKDRMRYQKNVPLSQYLQNTMGNKILSNENFPKIWMFLMQALVYLSSSKPEIEENAHTKQTYRPSARVRNKFSEIRGWDVGVRYGTTLRARTAQEKQNSKNSVGNTETEATASRHSPRPHARCAHWQRYWTGHGRTVPEMRWVAQVFVGASADETPATIHRVK